MDEDLLEGLEYEMALEGLIRHGLIEVVEYTDGNRYCLTHEGFRASAPDEVRSLFGWE